MFERVMEIAEILTRVLDSSPDEWIKLAQWPLDVTTDAEAWVERATFRPDASIGLVWGNPLVEDFKEDWANSFPDPSASSFSVFFTWNGTPVDDDFLVVVDGGRCYLPPPNVGTSEVPRSRYQLAGLLERIRGHISDFDSYFERSGLKVTDD